MYAFLCRHPLRVRRGGFSGVAGRQAGRAGCMEACTLTCEIDSQWELCDSGSSNGGSVTT